MKAGFKIKNFTGEDLALAEQSIRETYARLQEAEISTSSNRLAIVASREKEYKLAVDNYNNIINAINAVTNAQLQSSQSGYVQNKLQSEQSPAPKAQDYKTFIYIGIAILAIAFFWKS